MEKRKCLICNNDRNIMTSTGDKQHPLQAISCPACVIVRGYKLVTLRKDGTIGPLFIDKTLRFPKGEWIKAKAVKAEGFSFRPGFHACSKRSAPHLSTKGRVWCKVSLRGAAKNNRPESQGGLWYVAQEMKIDRVLHTS